MRSRRAGERHSERRQVVLTTHSEYLLCDQGVDGWEVLCVQPGREGSTVSVLADDPALRKILASGVMAGEIAPFRAAGRQLPLNLGLKA